MVVYKYYAPQDYNFEAVEKGYFFFSKAGKLNDPFDCSFQLVKPFSKFLEKILIDDKAEERMENFGTCSFSKEYNNKHLWALYAQSYQGFVVGYDDTTFEDLGLSLLAPFIYQDVKYLDALPDLDDPDFAVQWREKGKLQTIRVEDCYKGAENWEKNIDALFGYLCCVKEKSTWEVEHEMRLMSGRLNENSRIEKLPYGYKVPFPKKAVKSIFIGHNMSKENQCKICRIVKKYHLDELGITNPTTLGKRWEIDVDGYEYECEWFKKMIKQNRNFKCNNCPCIL